MRCKTVLPTIIWITHATKVRIGLEQNISTPKSPIYIRSLNISTIIHIFEIPFQPGKCVLTIKTFLSLHWLRLYSIEVRSQLRRQCQCFDNSQGAELTLVGPELSFYSFYGNAGPRRQAVIPVSIRLSSQLCVLWIWVPCDFNCETSCGFQNVFWKLQHQRRIFASLPSNLNLY